MSKKRKKHRDYRDWNKNRKLAVQKPAPGLSQETKNGIWGIVFFGAALLSALAFFHKAGAVGDIFAQISQELFGWGVFLVPLGFILLGVAFLKSISRKMYASAVLGTLLFTLSFLAIFYVLGNGDLLTRISQGGYLGLVIGFPLLKSVGLAASIIILLILLTISVLIALDIPVNIFKIKKEEDLRGAQVPLKDNVVIKRGSQVVDQKAEEAIHKAALGAQGAGKTKPATFKKEEDEEREFVIKSSRSGKWILPPLEILHSDKEQPRSGDINANVSIIKRTLANFGIDVEMGEVSIGPTVTQFTLRPAVGVKLSKIEALHKDLALALAAHPIRIEAPIPGKALVGIEVPNKKSALVGLRELFEAEDYAKSKFALPLALGRDVAGFPVYASLERMPHLLVAGATGTGKSVGINAILMSLLYKHGPDSLKFILVDPKRVELSLYNDIPHLITPVIVDAKKVVNALRWAVREMEKRYERLAHSGSRDIFSHNAKQPVSKGENEAMPFIVIVIDELADLMAAHGRDVEAAIVRLAQMARAVGIHLIVSTQRPSIEVITGLIKANITSRVAFQVASQVDSRTIIDMAGSEKLLGNGDMLFLAGDTSKPRRIQGSFVTEKEVKDVVKFIRQQAQQFEEKQEEAPANELKMQLEEAVSGPGGYQDEDMGDELFEEAKEVVVQAGKASASLLQRRLRVGYARAARLLDLLEEQGIIGPGEGAKPREVFVGRDNSRNVGMEDKIYDDGAVAEIAKTREEALDEKIATEE